ncbi:hypothetical protein [Micromonospora sp. NPDC047134]|uniref:hypothetical protein n=1 Tax=Micromonospora sp. NPDC047134 TaxID=3154340 RepID=UPI0033CFC61D
MTRTHLARQSHRRPAVLARRVVGTPAEVAATVALVRDSGRLLSMTAPQSVSGNPDRVTVTVRFLDTPTAAPPVVRRLRRGHVIAATIPAVAAVAGVGYAATQLATAVRSAAPLIAGVVLVLLVLAVLLRSRKSTCLGLHCSGCKH